MSRENILEFFRAYHEGGRLKIQTDKTLKLNLYLA